MGDTGAYATSSRIEITPLTLHIGAEIGGADLARPLPTKIFCEIRDALLRWKVIFFRNQQLDHDQHLVFARQLGEPTVGHVAFGHIEGYPEIYSVDTRRTANSVGTGEKVGRAWTGWHADVTTAINPPAISTLRAVSVPPYGGDTRWTNMVAAYDALDEVTKERIDDLEVAHLYGAGRLLDGEIRANPLASHEQIGRVPSCHHPLVMRHPVTGQKALYATGQSSYAITGMDNTEAVQLLWELKMHAIQDRFVYTHTYEVGDIAIFDTFSTMHSAMLIEAADPCIEDSKRLLWRISVRGKPRVYEHLGA